MCEDVILDAAKTAVKHISSFMLKVSAFRLRNASSARNNVEILSKQNFASPGMICHYNIRSSCFSVLAI